MSAPRRPVDPIERRNRTLAADLELLVRVAEGGGRLELSRDDEGYLALILPAQGLAYSARGRTITRAVRALRDELERLAAGGTGRRAS